MTRIEMVDFISTGWNRLPKIVRYILRALGGAALFIVAIPLSPIILVGCFLAVIWWRVRDSYNDYT